MADAVIRWDPKSTSPVTILSTGLNSLANNSGALSAAVANDASTERFLLADFELVLESTTAPTENALVELYIVRTVDGTNYEDNGTEGRPKLGYVGGFPVDNVTTVQRLILPEVRLPPMNFKTYLLNKIGQSIAASSNTLKAFIYTMKSDE